MSVAQSSAAEPTPKFDAALRSQSMASAASLAVASVAYLLTAKRQPRDSSATGSLSAIGQQAMEGHK